MQPSEIQLFHNPPARLRMTVRDRSYLEVRPVWGMSAPALEYLSLRDEQNQEIIFLPNPDALPPASLAAVREELMRRYLTAAILAVENIRQEDGAAFWNVETTRGPREFVTSGEDSIQWQSADHLLLISEDDDRFEIPSLAVLDPRSRFLLRAIIDPPEPLVTNYRLTSGSLV